MFLFYMTCLFLLRIAQTTDLNGCSAALHDSDFISAQIGDSVTLRCFYDDDLSLILFWYKQTLGQRPRLISSYYKYVENGHFYDEFKDNPRFTLESKRNHLTISDLHLSDSATYYCFEKKPSLFEFCGATTVSVRGSGLSIPALVRQPGGSVTLNCTVHTGSCGGEHRVYWFKTSEESHPGLIYTHGGRTDQSERESNTQTHTCVYHLSMKSLNVSDAETFDCAVVSCGHVLFGDQVKLDFEDDADPLVLVSSALAVTATLSVFLAFSVCVMNRTESCMCNESQGTFSTPSTTNGYHDEDDPHDTAVCGNKVIRRRGRRRDTWSECVYFVKQ